MYPVVEIFGPTIQGEGVDIGRKAYFIRFAGCDSDCIWCDTKYAQHGKQMSSKSILDALDVSLCNYVVLTGGNPLLHDLGGLVEALQDEGFKVAVETQGTLYSSWVNDVDLITLSPKGPSSGCETPIKDLGRFFRCYADVQLKVVVFDAGDKAYAEDLRRMYPDIQMVLQVGTEADDTAETLLANTKLLVNWVRENPLFDDVRVLPQLHVLLWGNRRGV